MTITQGYYITPAKLKRVKAAAKFAGRSVTWQSIAARPNTVDSFLAKVEPEMKKAKTRSKNPVKKKRSAKQLANDRRLGRMAKARAKKKRGGRRKVTKRKVTKRNPHATRRKTKSRTKLAKSHLQLVFACKGKIVRWLLMDRTGKWSWTTDKGKAILFKTKKQAASIAKGISEKPGYRPWQLGVVNDPTTSAQIRTHCSK